MKLPEREYYTLAELADRWKTDKRHLLELILNRHLDAVALYAGEAIQSWADEDRVPQEQKIHPMLEIRTWYDDDLLFDLYAKGSGTLTRIHQDGFEYIFDPGAEIDSDQLLVTCDEVKRLEGGNQAGAKADMDPRERATYLRLIRLLCELQDIDISRPYKAYEVLAQLAANNQLEMPGSENSIAEKLKSARDIE